MYFSDDTPNRIACPCGGPFQLTRTLTSADRFEKFLGFSVTYREWWVCSACGFAEQRYKALGLDESLRTISQDYFSIDFPGASVKDRFESIRVIPQNKSDNHCRVERVVKVLRGNLQNKQVSVADIGAGVGVFPVALLESFGNRISKFDVYETDVACRAFLSELSLFDRIFSWFPDGKQSIGYDFISMNKVLEHLSDPSQLLTAVRNELSRQGIVYVEVPGSRSILTVPEGDNSIGALHKHLHSRTSLSNLMLSLGFETLEDDEIVEPSGKISVWGFFRPIGNTDKNTRRIAS